MGAPKTYSFSDPLTREQARSIGEKLREAGVVTTNDGRVYHHPRSIIESKSFRQQVRRLKQIIEAKEAAAEEKGLRKTGAKADR